ncbi:MAG: response regulator [Oscillospiraceae bacterium]|nr:response regulator [Oscillospiraceae bacterium]
MLKVFLAEDEVIIREALRDSIPWEQHGFIFAGEASDGEMALEMVRKLKPDVVITDIRMPFMDGLTFSRYVSEELPDTKIIIISGYDDFEYARQAVELHADRFLLKPVTKADMISTLEDTRRRIEAEREKRLQDLQKLQGAQDPFSSLELSGFDPMVLGDFIEAGRAEDVDPFTERFIRSLHGAEQSMLFKNYLLVSIRISAANALQDAGLSSDALADLVPDLPMDYSGEELKSYLRTVLKQVIALRDSASPKSGGDLVEDALRYINDNYCSDDISLNTAAKAINVSSNYLSAIFSQKVGDSFIEYLTKKRMERAKQLLRETDKRSGEIALAVGYKDPRYFSYVFKRTQGCTPSEYRSREAE